MAKLNTLKQSTVAHVMLYGGPKSGKTQLAGELANHGFRLHWIDMENGRETLFKLPQEAQENIDIIALPDTRSYPIAIETCLKLVKAVANVQICDAHGKVMCLKCKAAARDTFTDFDPSTFTEKDIVVYDSATQLTNSGIANITKNQPDDYKLNYDDWGNLGKLLDIFYSHIQNAPYHVIVISHENEVDLAQKGKTALVPVSGTRNFSRNVGKYFGHIVYAERKNFKHVFSSSTTGSSSVLTGSRTDVDLEKSGSNSLLDIFTGAVATPAPASATKSILTGLKIKSGA